MKFDLISHQRYVETTYSKRNISQVIMNDLQSDPDIVELIEEAADALNEWRSGSYYHSKNERLSELSGRNMKRIVQEILCITSQFKEPMLYSSVAGELTAALKMSNKINGTKTAAEIIAVVSEFGFYDMITEEDGGSVYVASNIQLEEQTQLYIERKKYLPPMVCAPNIVSNNHDNALLTEQSSMILGKGTYHDGDICLDTINQFNQVPLTLNERLLTGLSETPKNPDMDEDVKRQWLTFVRESYATYRDLIQTGNRFYLTHKVDKRGRTYAQGYHVSTQGNQFRKAICEFANKEVIN